MQRTVAFQRGWNEIISLPGRPGRGYFFFFGFAGFCTRTVAVSSVLPQTLGGSEHHGRQAGPL
jgi:hypothetical protein